MAASVVEELDSPDMCLALQEVQCVLCFLSSIGEKRELVLYGSDEGMCVVSTICCLISGWVSCVSTECLEEL